MRSRKLSLGLALFSAAFVMATVMAPTRSTAQTVNIIHSFKNAGFVPGGYTPSGGLIFDNAGNLYGTDQNGGKYNGGTVYELVPNGSGGWTQVVLYNFNANTKDGYSPYSNLTFDAAGNLYGTTNAGGAYNVGTVFQLTPGTGGVWTEKVIHQFGAGSDGTYPTAGVILDAAGNIYGTASQGGTNNGGIAFQLKRGSSGNYVERVMHNFGAGTDGKYPIGGLLMDASGNLYGTAQEGGAYSSGFGTVYELKPQSLGNWAEITLHSFGNGQDGYYPQTALIFDATGNLYGTTQQGGIRRNGTVFQLTPTGGGSWGEAVLYNFNDTSLDEGIFPSSGVILDAAGNLFGETAQGSGNTYYGSVYELTPVSGGAYTETQMVKFAHQNLGSQPDGGLVLDSAGNLYGTTESGGLGGGGVVFEVTP